MRVSPLILLALTAATQLVHAEVVIPIDSVEFHVNVRFGADNKTEIVGHLQQGTSMPLVRSIPGWHEVNLEGGGTGFISEDWSVVVTEEQAAEALLARRQQAEIANTTDERHNGAEADDQRENPAPLTKSVAEMADDAVTANDLPAPDAAAITEPASQPEPASAAGTESFSDEIAGAAANSALAELESARQDQLAAAGEMPTDTASAPGTEAELLRAAEMEQQLQFAAVDAETGQPFLLQGPPGPQGPPGRHGADGIGTIEGTVDYLLKFTAPSIGGNSQVFDNGNSIGIGTNEPKQRLEVNGNIQIHERNSSVAGLILTQSSGDSGYIMHNRASTLTIGSGSVDRITIDRDGNVGIGMPRPEHPIEMASGAYVSAGGVWTNSSSRESKENVRQLTPEEALTALADLQAVRFNYRQDSQEEHLGFIAEDVPELVATMDRKGLSAMDVVAVLTTVLQAQQRRIDELESRLDQAR